jgi:hypothetical protein
MAVVFQSRQAGYIGVVVYIECVPKAKEFTPCQKQ